MDTLLFYVKNGEKLELSIIIRAAARLDFLRPEDGKSPYQLQPFAKRAEKNVSR